jgi:predicted RNase H-like HicB family nuclease
MKEYTVIVERGEHNLSAYVPGLPGCITTGRTVEGIERSTREAIELRLDGLREDGEPIRIRRSARFGFRELPEGLHPD